MAVGKGESGSKEEAGAWMAWAAPHKATSGGFFFQVRVTRQEWV